jgi:hypothetical protein
MITPFGRYRWARLPFGLKVSSEIFQRHLTEAVGDLNGTFTIADDIIIAGCGHTDEEAKSDHEMKRQYPSRISSLLNIRAFANFGSTSSSVVNRWFCQWFCQISGFVNEIYFK